MIHTTRLNGVYAKIKELHIKYAEDVRVGRLMCNILSYAKTLGKDVYYLEEDQFIDLMNEYLTKCKN